ncbi:MAG: glycosyltransferase [Muribaculaceae bacterium]|nr:glycosyltransferase [Muribaculaceae bacterium]
MKIEFLICTYNEGIYKIENLIMEENKDIRYLISHQITKSNLNISDCDFLKRKDIEYYSLYNKGVSKNRNNLLSKASGDICFISDDDVVYDMSNIRAVIKAFSENPDLDIYVGKIETYKGEPEYKEYSHKHKKLKLKDIGSVSSIEMVLRRSSFENSGVIFDERFGLGGKLYPKGEEAIFLSDCLKQGLKIEYFPQYIVKHPKESSASSVAYDAKETEYMGALSARIFKKIAILAGIAFSIKHFNRYKNYFSPIKYLHYFKKGINNLNKNS